MVSSENKSETLDTRISLDPPRKDVSGHRQIVPYPDEYETTIQTKSGWPLFIRPIKAEDAPLLEAFFNVLSPQTVYFRFFSPMKALSKKLLVYFTRIDYGRDMALVAIEGKGADERIIGVARLMREPNGERAEFAVVVGDPWQGTGIGAALMERLIVVARDRNIRSIWGIVLPENKQMLSLGEKLGFRITRIPFERHYELRASLA